MGERRDMTREEARWVGRLRRTLQACPDTLQLMTTGDQLSVVCAEGARGDLHDGRASERGVVLARMPGPICHGVSG